MLFLLRNIWKMTIFSWNFLYFWPISISGWLPPKNLLASKDSPWKTASFHIRTNTIALGMLIQLFTTSIGTIRIFLMKFFIFFTLNMYQNKSSKNYLLPKDSPWKTASFHIQTSTITLDMVIQFLTTSTGTIHNF